MSVSLATWRRMQRYLRVTRPSEGDIPDLAAACVFLNRTNFSGILHAKPIGGISQSSGYSIGCRFTKDTLINSIESLADLADRIDIAFGDGVSYLKRHAVSIARRDAVVYVDPPYYLQGRKLYRYHFADEDHERLARFLDESQFRWLVSYDNHPFVRRLFKNHTVVPILLNYVVKQSRRAQELLISNMPLPAVAYMDLGPKRRASATTTLVGGVG